MRRATRLLFVLGLLASNGVLMADYAAHAPAHRPVQGIGDVADDPGNNRGEHVYSWVRVRDVTDDGFVVGDGNHQFVVASDAPVEPGDHAQVFGTVRADRTIVAERVVVSPRANRRYMFAVSLGAVVLAFASFFRRWTVDSRRLVLRPRGHRRRDG